MKGSLFNVLVLCVSACAIGPQCMAKEKEVFRASEPQTSMEDLSAALKKNPRSKLFRVDWNTGGTLIWAYSVVLYNRENHTLKYYYSMDSLVDEGNERELPVRQKSSGSILYKGVQDSMIHRLLARYGQTSIGPDDMLPHLVDLGSRKQRISSKSRKYTVKQD